MRMIAVVLTIACLVTCSTAVEEECNARAPPRRFAVRRDRVSRQQCPTCSCASSSNVEFYNSMRPETCCGANEAKYLVKYVGTWTSDCHSDYYFSNAHWSPMTGVSHDHTYEVWNACMQNVSDGVALVSQLGAVQTIESEYMARGDSVKDILKGGVIVGNGTTMDEVSVDCTHPYVTVLTMLAPSLDRMVGVAGLKLCDGDSWKPSVKVCAELFSTATKSERVHVPRNTIQESNCSFGYFTFNLTESSFSNPTDDSCTCQAKVPQICPSRPNVDRRTVRTCCCKSTRNIKFYLPKGPNPVCNANGEPQYRVRFKSTWTQAAHPNYYFTTAHWSPLTGVSHDPKYEVWNSCMFNVTEGVALVSQIGAVGPIEGEYVAQGDLVKDTILGARIEQDGETNDTFTVNSTHNYVSVLTMLAPSVDQMVGVSRLDLCNNNEWRRYVKVCSELFSTATKSDRVGVPNSIQMDNCSFGYFEFKNLEQCYNTGFQVSDVTPSFCNSVDFVVLVRIQRGFRIYGHPEYDEFFNLTITVRKVYKSRGAMSGTVNILACDLPDRALNARGNAQRKVHLLLMGHYADDSNLVVSSNGYLEVQNRESKRKGRACK